MRKDPAHVYVHSQSFACQRPKIDMCWRHSHRHTHTLTLHSRRIRGRLAQDLHPRPVSHSQVRRCHLDFRIRPHWPCAAANPCTRPSKHACWGHRGNQSKELCKGLSLAHPLMPSSFSSSTLAVLFPSPPPPLPQQPAATVGGRRGRHRRARRGTRENSNPQQRRNQPNPTHNLPSRAHRHTPQPAHTLPPPSPHPNPARGRTLLPRVPYQGSCLLNYAAGDRRPQARLPPQIPSASTT